MKARRAKEKKISRRIERAEKATRIQEENEVEKDRKDEQRNG